MTETSTADTVDKRRFDGLMSAHQRALSMLTPEQRAALKGGAGEQAPDTGAQEQGLAGNGQETEPPQHTDPGYEAGGLYEYDPEAGFVAFEPPTPLRHGGASRSIAPKTEGTFADGIASLDAQYGKSSRMDWDIAKR